ncbi:MAG: ATP-binding protein [Ignavibacteriae bacterium]|nr:ATP-binding protein [Ignavibacteriota bacterium]
MNDQSNCLDIHFSKKLSSERKSLKLVEPLLKEIKQKFNIDEELYYNLVITVTEAVNNAIIHGNKFDMNKYVSINVNCDSKLLTVTVKDQGKGFDLNSIESPLLPENLLKESGRGIFIIRKIADKIKYNFSEEGTELQLFFYLKS